ncbi:MAG TPA: hypothetical protein DCZ63_08460 [Geobacter sp.]|nr:hypothetical protein [Geobacter sp.]
MHMPAELWDFLKLAFGIYLAYSLNRFNSGQRDQAKINKDLYEKHNELNQEFHELRGEHRNRINSGKCQ